MIRLARMKGKPYLISDEPILGSVEVLKDEGYAVSIGDSDKVPVDNAYPVGLYGYLYTESVDGRIYARVPRATNPRELAFAYLMLTAGDSEESKKLALDDLDEASKWDYRDLVTGIFDDHINHAFLCTSARDQNKIIVYKNVATDETLFTVHVKGDTKVPIDWRGYEAKHGVKLDPWLIIADRIAELAASQAVLSSRGLSSVVIAPHYITAHINMPSATRESSYIYVPEHRTIVAKLSYSFHHGKIARYEITIEHGP